jgi:hypothetical protein
MKKLKIKLKNEVGSLLNIFIKNIINNKKLSTKI